MKGNYHSTIEGQSQENKYSFTIEAEEIKVREDIQEIIHQCQLVENQLPDESNHFFVSDEGAITLQSDNT